MTTDSDVEDSISSSENDDQYNDTINEDIETQNEQGSIDCAETDDITDEEIVNCDKNDRPIRSNRGKRKFLDVSHDNKTYKTRANFLMQRATGVIFT